MRELEWNRVIDDDIDQWHRRLHAFEPREDILNIHRDIN